MEKKKLSMFYILNVLKEYTDEEHYLTQKDIISKVYEKYNIKLERKSVSSSLKALEVLNFDINNIPRKGYYLLDREFNKSEIHYLIDAILSSKSLNYKEAHTLINKCMSFFSIYDREKDFSNVRKASQTNRTNNEEIMLNVELLNEAIKNRKKVSLNYMGYNSKGELVRRNPKYKYIMNPYYLFNSMGKYYLLCNSDYFSTIASYRVDFMQDIEILDVERKREYEISDLKNFSINDFINNRLYLFHDNDVITSKIRVLGEEKQKNNTINIIKDWFGRNAKIINKDNEIYAFVKCDERSLKYWALQYGTSIEIISPQSLKVNVIKDLTSMLNIYKES